jgi:hypothetical protein
MGQPEITERARRLGTYEAAEIEGPAECGRSAGGIKTFI